MRRLAELVDEQLRTSDPDIYAAGDIAAWPDPTFGRILRVEHWDVAFRQGLRAGRNMAGEAKPYRTLPYFFSDMFDLSLEVWGNLSAWDRTVLRGTIKSGSYAFYYFEPDASSGLGQGKHHPGCTYDEGIPAGQDAADAMNALRTHLLDNVPWGADLTIVHEEMGAPFELPISGPAPEAWKQAMQEVWGTDVVEMGVRQEDMTNRIEIGKAKVPDTGTGIDQHVVMDEQGGRTRAGAYCATAA